jgi:hypothetical protein
MEQYLLPAHRDYKTFDDDILFGLDKGIMTQHLTYKGMLDYRGEPYMESHFKFAFFRNTWDRLASCFNYLRPLYIRKYGSFDRCIEEVCKAVSANKTSEGWHFSRQTDYLFRNKVDGDLAVDFIGRYENLQDDFNKVCNILNVPYTELPKTNSSKKSDEYRAVYTDYTRQLVADAYSSEIEYFGYQYAEK